ncbi:Methyltransferase-like protein 7B [Colletotrichum trifolii]|uniref:Methyltransferase-like protein 7B n=1 Tax=Colletotrichum trifolii TaxID=5466 RepID=A0A4R8RNY5_COLTR|nr:Methyltransferase-like protein 7B [Colletotrichum trifolii]
MPSAAALSELFWCLVGPWMFLYTVATYLPSTVLRLAREGNLASLLSLSRLQGAWFNAFWSFWGPQIRTGRHGHVSALLEGRVSAGHVVETPVHPPVGGVVLEIGPGAGYWVNLFSSSSSKHSATAPAPAAGSPGSGAGGLRRRVAEGVTRVYGVEPNADAHPALRQSVKEAGLEGVYEIVPAGIESLSDPSVWDGKIEKGSVDCIFSILCLCSIPEPERNIQELYSYLKKGGRWYLYEHVEVSRSLPIRLYQRFVNLFWPRALNGCQLCRNTGQTLQSAGPWSKVDMAQPPEEPWCQVVPHIFGTLTK